MAVRTVVVTGIVALVVLATGVGALAGMNLTDSDTTPPAAPSTQETSGTQGTTSTQNAPMPLGQLPDLVDRVQPSVVSIATMAQTPQGLAEGIGSGFIVDNEGHILTNYHVIQGSSEVTVQLADGTLATAEVRGTDPANDLALLRIDVNPDLLQPVTLGDSDAVRVGEPAFAIGSPFGLAFTVTSGIISAVDRDELISPAQRPILGVIQTDAPINPGNSGGPLFNMSGEVVGINTAIRSAGEGQSGFIGIGLVVPVNSAKRYLDQMIAGELIRHAQLGISGIGLTPQMIEDAGIDVESGVYVLQAVPGGAADTAGIRGADAPPPGPSALPAGGDVIVTFDGEEVTDLNSLRTLIDRHEPGDRVEVEIVRDGERMTVTATLDEWMPPSS